MLKGLARVDGAVIAAGNRWSAYGGFAGFVAAMTVGLGIVVNWLRPFFPATWGWPEAVAIAFVSVCGLIFLSSLFLIAWRYFRAPPAPQPASTGNERLVRVERQKFKNETVVVDGKYFFDCEFENVRFRYLGGRFFFKNNNITGERAIEINSQPAFAAVELLKICGFLTQEFRDRWSTLPKEHFENNG
jgi:hypothetical protein